MKLRLTFRALQDMNFPLYAGSTLRGIFGKALRRVSCLAQRTNCAGCGVVSTCPYAVVFENGYLSNGGDEIPNPYVIEPPEIGTKIVNQGDCFSFHILLFGNAVEKLSYVLLAWAKTGKLGFTAERTQARLIAVEQVFSDGSTVLLHDFENTDEETCAVEQQTDLPAPLETTAVKIKLETPLRIHHNGHPVIPEKLTARDFLIALIRRQQNMAKYHIPDFPPINFDALRPLIESAKISNANLRWFDWARYSSRQKTRIALGGIVGTFTLCGNLTELTPYLIAGQSFHVGKSAVLGLGKYEIALEHNQNTL